MIIDRAPELVTPAVRLGGAALEEFVEQKKERPGSGTTVVFDVNKNALYFSKTILPHIRNAGHAHIYRHIGLYGYRKAALERYMTLAPSRWSRPKAGAASGTGAWHGRARPLVDYRGRTHWSIDAPGDVAIAENIIKREGELLEAQGGGRG